MREVRKYCAPILAFSCLLVAFSPVVKAAPGEALGGQVGTPREAHKQRMKELHLLVVKGRAATVQYELESIVKQNPRDVDAWLLLSRVYSDLDYNDSLMPKAIHAALMAVQAAPNNSTCLKTLAELYAKKGRFDEARKLLDKAMLDRKVDPFVYKAYALILSETKHDKEAVKYWEMFESVSPNALNNIKHMDAGAIIYARAGMTDKAAALYDQMFLKDHNSRWLQLKAEAYMMVGRSKDALAVYSKMIVDYPEDELARVARAKLYTKLGRDKEALADMDVAIKELPTTSLYLERARIYDKLGNAEAAKRDRERANRVD